jgi:hypothetical protein
MSSCRPLRALLTLAVALAALVIAVLSAHAAPICTLGTGNTTVTTR